MLTSTKNPRIQYIRKLQRSSRLRRQEGVFIVEGVRLIEESHKAGWLPDLVLFTDDISQRGQLLLQLYKDEGVDVLQVAPHVMQAAGDIQTPQGILAVVPILELHVPEEINFLLILDGIRDPGNLGTILRTAQAAGIDAVVTTPGTVDPFSPKVIRSGMGAHFKLPIHQFNWGEIQDLINKNELLVFIADSSNGKLLYDTDFKCPLALIIGGEAEGASLEAVNIADNSLHIPMVGEIDSLNSAVAAAILMFEVLHQRSHQNSSLLKK